MGRRAHRQHAASGTEKIEARIRRCRTMESAADLRRCHRLRRNGPDANLPGFDITSYWARSGLLSMTRDAGAPPTWPVAGSGDNATAVGLYSAIVTALYRRERTGKGRMSRRRCSPRECGRRASRSRPHCAGRSSIALHDRKNPANAALNVYRASDGNWFVLIVTPDKLAAVAKAIGRADLLTDPRFSDPAKLAANMAAARRHPRRGLRRTADGALVRGLQWRPRHLRCRARAARGDQRSAACARTTSSFRSKAPAAS